MIIYLKSINLDLWDIVVNGYTPSKKNYNEWNCDTQEFISLVFWLFNEFLGNNWVEHSSLNENEDPSGARDQHGDRVIAAALAVKVMTISPSR